MYKINVLGNNRQTTSYLQIYNRISNSHNILRIFHILFNLTAQTPDVHINRTISDKSIIAQT